MHLAAPLISFAYMCPILLRKLSWIEIYSADKANEGSIFSEDEKFFFYIRQKWVHSLDKIEEMESLVTLSNIEHENVLVFVATNTLFIILQWNKPQKNMRW